MQRQPSGQGPAGDEGVDFAHEADGFGDGDDDFLVVVNVVGGEEAAFAILEPLFSDLVAADMEVPNFRRHAFEILHAVDEHPPRRLAIGGRTRIPHLLHKVVAALVVAGLCSVKQG